MAMIQRVAIYVRTTGTSPELLLAIRRIVEDRGGTVDSSHIDDGQLTGRGKYAAWHKLVANLGAVDRIVIADAGHIPGRTVADLLKVLAVLRDHGVILHLHNIETGVTTSEVLDIIAACRSARLSAAIRQGQAKARDAGKRIGRPAIPGRVARRIQDALANGGGIRPTARRFNVSPASVVNVRRTMAGASCTSF
jgi:DNA invertase Pin-like site-specific DNA recombinase